jgi:L-ascorbate metabolism protein UlaG (beta-lactamase superfamily)
VLVTHDDFDYLRDAFEIAKNANTKLIGIIKIVGMAQKAGVKKENTFGMNMSSISALEKYVLKITPAIHSGNMVVQPMKKQFITWETLGCSLTWSS